jgi:hypothetical protein
VAKLAPGLLQAKEMLAQDAEAAVLWQKAGPLGAQAQLWSSSAM